MPKSGHVLVVQHAALEAPAGLGRALRGLGIPTRVFRTDLDSGVRESSAAPGLRGILSLGGFMGVGDAEQHPWINQEIQLLRDVVDRGLTVVGVCLGGQMLAQALGGRVGRSPRQELGWHPIEVNPVGAKDPLLAWGGKSVPTYQWHQDSFVELPRGAVLLAGSAGCPHQAYKIGDRVYGVQYHPEADERLVSSWTESTEAQDEIRDWGSKSPFVQSRSEQLALSVKHELHAAKLALTTAAILATPDYEPIDCAVHDRYEELSTLKTHVNVVLSPLGEGFQTQDRVTGTIAGTWTYLGNEYLFVREAPGILWPIRLDQIQDVRPV